MNLVYIALGVVIAAALLSAPVGEEQVTETYYTSEPYSYEQSLAYVTQVKNFPFIHKVTRAQYLVKNTDAQKGTFLLNFKFDNGTDIATKSMKVDILSGEEKAVKMDSSLSGESEITLTVVPPKKSIPQQREVTVKRNGWYYLSRLAPFIK